MGNILTRGNLPPGMTPKRIQTPGGGGSFSNGPIRLLDSTQSWSALAGDNRNFGMAFYTNQFGALGSGLVGDSFNNFLGAFFTNRPQWHEDEPAAATGGVDGTNNFEMALLSIVEEPSDLSVEWPSAFAVPALGTYFNMTGVPVLRIPTSATDIAGSTRVFIGVFSIRRKVTFELMAQATIRFEARKT